MSASSNAEASREPRTFTGRRVVLISALILFTLVPLATWRTLRWVESRNVPDQPIVWADRASWHAIIARPASLLKSSLFTPPQSGVYRNIDDPPREADRVALRAAVAWMVSDSFAELDGAVPDTINTLPDHFAVHFAVGHQHRLRGDHALADEAWTKTFASAPRALVVRFVDEQGQPVTGLELGDITFNYAVVQEQALDESVNIVLPDAVTDERGQLYVPVWTSPVRMVTRPQVAGRVIEYGKDEWYDFPGNIGRLPDAVVR